MTTRWRNLDPLEDRETHPRLHTVSTFRVELHISDRFLTVATKLQPVTNRYRSPTGRSDQAIILFFSDRDRPTRRPHSKKHGRIGHLNAAWRCCGHDLLLRAWRPSPGPPTQQYVFMLPTTGPPRVGGAKSTPTAARWEVNMQLRRGANCNSVMVSNEVRKPFANLLLKRWNKF